MGWADRREAHWRIRPGNTADTQSGRMAPELCEFPAEDGRLAGRPGSGRLRDPPGISGFRWQCSSVEGPGHWQGAPALGGSCAIPGARFPWAVATGFGICLAVGGFSRDPHGWIRV